MANCLQELRKERIEWVEASRKNKFEKGIKTLLTQLYPDNAHFIYELLQNAEDPCARVVRFTLTSTGVEFEHDGSRLFDLKDVESITSIGESTKRDDHTSIGKFGVGFKAVFAYTNTPEIHSGEFHFRIHDLVVPEINGVSTPDMRVRKTWFNLPFNHPTKRPAQAAAEVESALRALGDNTLLFLTHIRTIEYLLPDGSSGSLERVDHEGGRIEIRARDPGGKDTVSHWLRFQKDVEVIDEDGKTKTCRIAIAYSLVKDADSRKRHSGWKIVPLDLGQVSIYFPAEKETSNLRFHIHAPFASTVARDSVRDCEANRQLRDRIADLVVESLTNIRDSQMLTMGFLAVLPNQMDNLPSFYEPIREAAVRAFRDEHLTPTKSGAHAPATGLYRGPARISEVLNDDDLSLLTNSERPLWAANPPQQNQREDRFLDSLMIKRWEWSELTKVLSRHASQDQELIRNWIARKDDAWVMRFYALLGEAKDDYHKNIYPTDLRIVRVEVVNGHDHVSPDEAYFPPEQETSLPRDLHFVKPSVYRTGGSKTQKMFAASFLEGIGVRPYDAKAVIELRLGHYDDPPNQIGDGYYKDMSRFVAYWKKYPADADLFKRHSFLLGLDAEGNRHWDKPTLLCMDKPYLETGLADLQNIHKKLVLWEGYHDKLTKLSGEEFVNFLQAIGVETRLQIVKASCDRNPEWSYLSSVPGERLTSPINRDYTIRGLDQLLAKPSLQISRLIWRTMCSLPRYPDPDCLIATYQKSERWGRHCTASQLVHALRQHSWVPQGNGIFVRPAEGTRELLPEGFPFDAGWDWLVAIGFEKEANKKTEEYQQKQAVARELGFESFEEAEEWKKVRKKVRDAGFSPGKLLDLVARHRRVSQPEESVPNPERRRKGVLERSDNAPTKESVTRERTIQPGAGSETCEAKAYLRAKYRNPEGQLVCQCCHAEMPFKVRDDYYFEAVQCVRDLDHHYFENRLALCPTCAAMYQYARETEDAEIRRAIVESDVPDTVPSTCIPVRLAGNEHRLRFVGSHFLDLKTVLKP